MLLCIDWYTCRWIIEEVFRILKKEGFDIEASELSKGKAIRKLCLMTLETIIKLFSQALKKALCSYHYRIYIIIGTIKI